MTPPVEAIVDDIMGSLAAYYTDDTYIEYFGDDALRLELSDGSSYIISVEVE
jgi:hypothetical protein